MYEWLWISCWLDGGLILQQTNSLWFFNSWVRFISIAKKMHFYGVFTQAMWDDWIIAFKVVKVQHSHIVVSLIFEFEQWFPS
jgi:hypothetical protein